MTDRAVHAIVAAFTERFLNDRERGQILPLEQYQARLPGYDDAIAHEYGVLTGAAEADPPSRPTVQRYEDRGRLGQGGMGEVRCVFDREIRREVARKTLRRDGAAPELPHNAMRFVEEAQIAGQLEHPGIIPVYDLGVDEEDCAYFTMSLVRGREFGEIISDVHARRDGWTLTRALDVLLRVCDAVAFAHSKRVAHRDLKPANVLVGEFGRTYVVDWGLARVLERSPDGEGVSSIRDALQENECTPAVLTMQGDVLGTASYMAPEQADGDVHRVGFASDAYALGSILYQLLTGRAPYSGGEASTSAEVLAQLRMGPPPSVHSINRDAPTELVAVCEKAMARLPGDRYASVSDFADDLRAFLELRVVKAYGGGALVELTKWVRRNKTTATVGAIAMVALVVAFAFSLAQLHRADAQTENAEASAALTRRAMRELLTEVANETILLAPHMAAFRRSMLEKALALQRELFALRSEEPTAILPLGVAHVDLGTIQRWLGQYAEAEGALAKGVALLEPLAAEQPHSVFVQRQLAVGRLELGTLSYDTGKLDAALTHYRSALDGIDAGQRWLTASPITWVEWRVLNAMATALDRKGATLHRSSIATEPSSWANGCATTRPST